MEKQINDPKILNYLIEQTNAKIDIFQNTDSFVLHTDLLTVSTRTLNLPVFLTATFQLLPFLQP